MISRHLPVLGILLFFSLGCSDVRRPTFSGNEVNVTVVTALSGSSGGFSAQALEGFEAARQTYPLLHNGDRIRLDIVESNGTRRDGKPMVEEALRSGSVAVVSMQNSKGVLALAPLAAQVGMPLLAVTATHEKIPEFPTAAQLSMSNETEAEAAAYYIHDERFIDRIGIVYDRNDPFSVSLSHHFAEVFDDIGGKITAIAALGDEALLYQLRRMRSAGAEAVYIVLYSAEAARVLKVMNRMGWQVPTIGVDGLVAEAAKVRPWLLPKLEGMIVIDHFADIMPHSRRALEAKRGFERMGVSPSTVRYLGYEAYLLIAAALDACAGYRRECINASLRDSAAIAGIGGRFGIARGRAQRPVFIDRVKEGRLKMVVKVY